MAGELDARGIAIAEDEVNRIVWEDRPVEVRFVPADEAARLPLRKPTDRIGTIRLVDIHGVDLSACGGTHARTTGMVGLVAVTGWERCKGGTRVSFVCGGRALASHRRLRDVVAGAGRLLSSGAADIGPRIEQLQTDARVRLDAMADLQAELAQYRARAWREAAETIGPCRVVLRSVPETEPAVLKALAQAIVAESGFVAVLVGEGVPRPLVIARADGAAIDANRVVKAVTGALGGRGGGRPEIAQAGVPAEADAIVTVVRQALIP